MQALIQGVLQVINTRSAKNPRLLKVWQMTCILWNEFDTWIWKEYSTAVEYFKLLSDTQSNYLGLEKSRPSMTLLY